MRVNTGLEWTSQTGPKLPNGQNCVIIVVWYVDPIQTMTLPKKLLHPSSGAEIGPRTGLRASFFQWFQPCADARRSAQAA